MTRSDDTFGGTTQVRERHRFDERSLARWMAAHIEDYEGPLTISQFKGGQSNPTYKLSTPQRSYVLRRKPPGKILKGAHAVEREYRVTRALSGAGFPVARLYGLCEDEKVIGTPFYVMDMVEGRVFWDSSMPGVDGDERAALFGAMNTTIARLHNLDFEALGLSDYGKPGNFFERQISRWSRQYVEDKDAGRLPDMDRLMEWLPANIPPGDETSIVHGDFRADNVIFHPDKPEVLAVLDWELSTLGHPLADFTYHLMMYHFPPEIIGGFAGADLETLNIPSEKAYVQAYCRRTGREGIENLHFYLAFNMFRFGAIVHGITGRMLRGTASSANAKTLVDTLPTIAKLGWAQTVGYR